jgi:acetyl/propionyl-CoA carboxylase alpha subunit
MIYNVIIDGESFKLELELADGRWKCLLDGRAVELDAVLTRRGVLSILTNGRGYEVTRERNGGITDLWVGNARYAVDLLDPRSLHGRKGRVRDDGSLKKLTASMPGKVVRVLVGENAKVEAGQGILVVEAMKMQNEIKSPKAGTVRKLMAAEGANVNAGDVLAIVE